jgi:putative peptidoglycan lipid II flippase
VRRRLSNGETPTRVPDGTARQEAAGSAVHTRNATDAGHRHQGALSAAIRVVSGLTLLSRFAGLARDIVTANIFGNTALSSAFRAAYAIPNLFRRLFGEGALSAAFLPEYTRLRRDQPDAAHQLASMILRMLVLTTGTLTLLIEAVLLVLLLFRGENASLALSIKLMMLMLPMMPMVCITAILGGVLQAHGKFAPTAAAPIILNLFQIAAGALFFFKIIDDQILAAYLVGGAAVVASIAQIIWSLAGLKDQVRWTRTFDLARESAKVVRSRFLPALLGLGALQLNTFLDMLIAMSPNWFGDTLLGQPNPLDQTSNAVVSYTQTLYQFPLGVFGIAVATAIFPLLSRASSEDEFTHTLRRGVRLSLFIALPATLGLILVRNDIVAVVLAAGKNGFDADGLARSAAVLCGFASAVWAYSINHTLTRAFYAKGDTKTPMNIAIAAVFVNFTLNMLLIWPLREAGLAWATAISASGQTAALLMLLRRRHHVHVLDKATIAACVRIAIGVALMAGAAFGVERLLPDATRWLHHFLRLLALVGVGAITFAAFSYLLKLPELKWMLHPAPRDASGKVVGISMD